MKIFFEDTMPMASQLLSSLGNCEAYKWQTIRPQDLSDVDILAVRSTTQVSPQLLQQAQQLSFVTTATAGTNHMDTAWLTEHNIDWSSAAGCNAVAVAEYVLSVLVQAQLESRLSLSDICVGIVGAGHVGSALAHRLKALGIDYKLCDPPLQEAGDSRPMVAMHDILSCDVITMHVPYSKQGRFATEGLLNADMIAQLKSNQLLINACRGEVVDETALLKKLQQADAPTVVLDVWHNEPNINHALLSYVWLATPHIAGHSIEGKVRGSVMVYEQICQRIQHPIEMQLSDLLPPTPPIKVALNSPYADRLSWHDFAVLMNSIYDIKDDDRQFRECMAQSGDFAALRKGYRQAPDDSRRECSAYTLTLPVGTSDSIRLQLEQLGFTLSA